MNRSKHKYPELNESSKEDIKLAAKMLTGASRRSYQAEMAEKYCGGSARVAETVFGWDRYTVVTGLGEKRSGIICLGAQSSASGAKRWEERYPEAAGRLQDLVDGYAQQDPTFNSTVCYLRLTAEAAIKLLRESGVREEELPSRSTMSEILNRMGYKLRKVLKAKPQKKFLRQTPSLTT